MTVGGKHLVGAKSFAKGCAAAPRDSEGQTFGLLGE
jgi:hypothetical protein